MHIWDVPSSLDPLDKYASLGCFPSLAGEGWKGKEAKLGSGSHSCKHAQRFSHQVAPSSS